MLPSIVIIAIVQVISVKSTGEKAFQACKSYGQSMLECHNILYPKSRIRVPIDFLLYPHMVLIGFRANNQDNPVWKCGGTLVSETWVMTAAHCKEDPSTGPASVLRIGTATFEFDEVDEMAQERNVTQVIIHPEFKPPSKYNDIALMKADTPFILSRDIRIACLNLEDDIGKVNLTAIGFGVTQTGATTGSQTLMNVEVDQIASTVCNKSMTSLIRKKIIAQGITDTQICAGDYDHGGRDTCQGDSGGPLQYMVDRVDCVNTFPLHKVVGVTSFGRDCGRKMTAGVYTRVSRYIDWIESIVWP